MNHPAIASPFDKPSSVTKLRGYQVFVKEKKDSEWRDVGVIESDPANAFKVWKMIIKKIGYYNYKLEPYNI